MRLYHVYSRFLIANNALQFGSAKSSPVGISVESQVDDTNDQHQPTTNDEGADSKASNVPEDGQSRLPVKQSAGLSIDRSPSPVSKSSASFNSSNSSSSPFHYPFHQRLGKGLFDTQTATAIQG